VVPPLVYPRLAVRTSQCLKTPSLYRATPSGPTILSSQPFREVFGHPFPLPRTHRQLSEESKLLTSSLHQVVDILTNPGLFVKNYLVKGRFFSISPTKCCPTLAI